jgi:hypothetical protein
MTWSRRAAWAVMVAVGLMVCGGCGSPPPRSGFLPAELPLVADPECASRLWWEADGVDWSRYKRVMIDEVTVSLHGEALARTKTTAEERRTLASNFRQIVVKELGGSYPVVAEAGPDVLRIRAALTDVAPTDRLTNAATLAAVGVPFDLGGASVEAAFLDSRSGQLLAAVVDRKSGNPLKTLDGLTRWDHAKTAFTLWAKELRDALDQSHGKPGRSSAERAMDRMVQ